MTSTTESPERDTGARVACLQRLATALSGYSDLHVTVQADGPAPCLAARNTAAPCLAETVTVTRHGDTLAYTWSWGERISDASDTGDAAVAVAYVLSARGTEFSQ